MIVTSGTQWMGRAIVFCPKPALLSLCLMEVSGTIIPFTYLPTYLLTYLPTYLPSDSSCIFPRPRIFWSFNFFNLFSVGLFLVGFLQKPFQFPSMNTHIAPSVICLTYKSDYAFCLKTFIASHNL